MGQGLPHERSPRRQGRARHRRWARDRPRARGRARRRGCASCTSTTWRIRRKSSPSCPRAAAVSRWPSMSRARLRSPTTSAGLERLDVLVNCAGIPGWMNLDDPSGDTWEEVWDRVIDTNLKGTFFCSVEAARLMRAGGGGSIVNVSSVVAARGLRNLAAYAASKGGINALTDMTDTRGQGRARHGAGRGSDGARGGLAAEGAVVHSTTSRIRRRSSPSCRAAAGWRWRSTSRARARSPSTSAGLERLDVLVNCAGIPAG